MKKTSGNSSADPASLRPPPRGTEGSERPSTRRAPADRFALAWSSCLGVGYFPFASGTAGTLAALPAAYLLSLIASPFLWGAVVAAFTAITVWASHRAGKALGVVDASQIVADEWAGFFLAVGLLPFSWKVAVAGFFLFRFFDIVKPWPASYFDRKVRNGFGVTFDDVAAGIWTRIVLEVAYRYGLLGG